MRAWNRAKLLWGYLRRSTAPGGLPVEYIVETTAKCNLYCPMCPRETHKQPKEDMTDESKAKLQVVMQMVRMEMNADEVEDFRSFWTAILGIDQVRIKEDETNVLQPLAGRDQNGPPRPCHYLWRGPMYVKHNGDVY